MSGGRELGALGTLGTLGTVSTVGFLSPSLQGAQAPQLSAQAQAHLEEMGIEIVKTIAISELDNLPPQGGNWLQSGIDVAIAAGRVPLIDENQAA